MNNLVSDATEMMNGWLSAFGVILLTLVANSVARWLLRKLALQKHIAALKQLAPGVSGLIFVLGFMAFVEVAPLHARISMWLSSGSYVLAILIFLWLARRAAMIGIEWGMTRTHHSRTLQQQGFIPLVRNLVTLFVFLTGAIMILKHFNYDVMSLITALGVGSLAVGLAAKDTLSHMISGFTLIIDRNLTPGDRINLNGSVGVVDEIGLRSTRIRMDNGNMLIVPNSELVNTKLLNLSQPSSAISCGTTIKVPVNVPHGKIKAICFETIEEVSKALKDRPKWVNLSSLSDGVQQISLGFWVAEPGHEGGAISDFNERLLQRLEKEGIPLIAPLHQFAPTSSS